MEAQLQRSPFQEAACPESAVPCHSLISSAWVPGPNTDSETGVHTSASSNAAASPWVLHPYVSGHLLWEARTPNLTFWASPHQMS